MKSKNLIAGLLILFIGVVALLAALHVFDFHWAIIWRLWPLILILFGITLLPINDYLKGVLVLLALGAGCLLYHVETQRYEGNAITRFYNKAKSFRPNKDTDDADKEGEEDPYDIEQHFSEPYEEVDQASISIDFGAGNLNLQAPCAELFKMDAKSNFVKYSLRAERGDDNASLFVTGKGQAKHIHKDNNNDVDIALCNLPVWRFSLDMGAADAILDFSPYKLSSIEINGGACHLDLKLGDNGCDTQVEINTGASDINIKVPSGVDCEVDIDSAITGKDFNGFEKIERGLWRTPGFGQGEHQIRIDIDCAVSNISVERY